MMSVAAAGIVASVIFFYLYWSAQREVKTLKDPQALALAEARNLSGEIGKLYVLPKDETPTVATVTDAEKLQNQPFFASAANGDKILIFPNANRAILYRPGIEKIIDVAPFNLEKSPTKLRISLFNGTADPSLTDIYVKNLQEKVGPVDAELQKKLEIVSRGVAKSSDYVKTLVIDINGNQKENVEKVAKAIGGEVAQLPTEESKPDTDILIIIGKGSSQ